ncbi:TPA: 40S ribosomal protein S17 [Trebouxia sp. C0005]
MGRVRTKTVKKASRVIIEKYYNRLTLDFHTNKRVAEEVAVIQSKRLRNKIAGFTTHLMKRIQRGPVRGISLKLQEEERERRMDFVPEESAVNTETIEIDQDTNDLLRSLNMVNLPGVKMVPVSLSLALCLLLNSPVPSRCVLCWLGELVHSSSNSPNVKPRTAHEVTSCLMSWRPSRTAQTSNRK